MHDLRSNMAAWEHHCHTPLRRRSTVTTTQGLTLLPPHSSRRTQRRLACIAAAIASPAGSPDEREARRRRRQDELSWRLSLLAAWVSDPPPMTSRTSLVFSPRGMRAPSSRSRNLKALERALIVTDVPHTDASIATPSAGTKTDGAEMPDKSSNRDPTVT